MGTDRVSPDRAALARLAQLYTQAAQAATEASRHSGSTLQQVAATCSALRLIDACGGSDSEPGPAQQARHHARAGEWDAARLVLGVRAQVILADLCDRAEEF